MEKLKEHRLFRNQLIIATILLLIIGISMNSGELTAFGILFCLIALFNIFSYRENVKDYKKLYRGK